MSSKLRPLLTFSLFIGFATGCHSNENGKSNDYLQEILKRRLSVSSPMPTPESQGHVGAVGNTCKNGDSDRICLALKYVVYANQNGVATVDQGDAIRTIDGINQVWSQCNLGFQIENFLPVSAAEYGLRNRPANETELSDIRKAFMEDNDLLVVTTGSWDRSGSLGYTGANAWTSMPGESLYGVVLEKSVGTFSNIVAHELGHYLNLPHTLNARYLMNPVIYDSSNLLSKDQCELARNTATSYWQRMMR